MKGRDECGEAQRGIQMEVEGGGRDDVEALAASGELPNTNGGGRGGWRGAEFRKVRFPACMGGWAMRSESWGRVV
jgi:hypothetical protein